MDESPPENIREWSHLCQSEGNGPQPHLALGHSRRIALIVNGVHESKIYFTTSCELVGSRFMYNFAEIAEFSFIHFKLFSETALKCQIFFMIFLRSGGKFPAKDRILKKLMLRKGALTHR